MRSRHTLLLVALAINTAPLHGQRRLNLDFEEERMGHPGLPWGWYEADNSRPGSIRLDSLMHYSGRRSLRLTRPVGATGGTATRLFFDSLDAGWRKARLRFSARVFADSLIQGHLALRVIQWGGGHVIRRDTAVVGPTSDGQWHLISVDFSMDTGATSLALAVGLPGTGTAWVDAGKLLINETPVVSDPVWNEHLPQSLASWLRDAEHPLTGLQTGGDTRDLVPLGELLRGARVIAIGESTHGTSEFRRMDARLAEFAATNLGVTLFALEESPVLVAPLNRYVLTGEGDPSATLGRFYAIWQTQEILDLVEWMRRYNAARRGHIEFAGIDVINAQPTIDSVVSFLRRVEPAYASQAEAEYKDLRHAWAAESLALTDTARLDIWKRATRAVLEHMTARRDDYAARVDSSTLSWAMFNAQTVNRIAIYMTPPEQTSAFRDSCMALGLEWQIARRGPGTKAVVVAHSMHVRKRPGAMGGFLVREFGDQYRVISQTTYVGSYTAYTDTSRGRALAWRGVSPDSAPAAALEAALHATGVQRSYLDLRAAASGAGGAPLLSPMLTRNAGASAVEWPFEVAAPARLYDVLVFIDHTTPTHMLPCAPGNTDFRCR